jgi:hypothetical protein
MLILKRFIVWLLEFYCVALLLTGFVGVSYGDVSRLGDSLRYAWAGVLIFMLGTGFVITMAIVGIVWRGRGLWRYPAIVAGLFTAHLLWFWVEAPGWSTSRYLSILAAGVVIVFACTLGGNLLLRRWVQAASK